METFTAIDAAAIIGLLASGAVQKHFLSWVPNDAIPFINLALASVVMYFAGGQGVEDNVLMAIVAGLQAAIGATGAHQIIKITRRKATGPFASRSVCVAFLALLGALAAAPASHAEALTFQPYKPAYAVYQQGEDGVKEIRYRYSTQVPLWTDAIDIPYLPAFRPIFAYTQKSVIEPDSSFRFVRDDYMPELFAEVPMGYRWLESVRLGYEHRSSGEDAELSNGIDLGFVEATVPVWLGERMKVHVWARARYIIAAEPNTEGVRDLVSVWGKDFYPTGGVDIETAGGTYSAEFTRDSFDAEAMLALASRWNFSVFAQYHGGTLQDIARWAADTQSGGAGLAFAW